jgi:hypothetical protein
MDDGNQYVCVLNDALNGRTAYAAKYEREAISNC